MNYVSVLPKQFELDFSVFAKVSVLTVLDCRRFPCDVLQCCNCLNEVLTLLVGHYQHLNCFSTMTWIPSCSIHSSLLIWRNTILFILSIFLTHSKFFDFSPVPNLLFSATIEKIPDNINNSLLFFLDKYSGMLINSYSPVPSPNSKRSVKTLFRWSMLNREIFSIPQTPAQIIIYCNLNNIFSSIVERFHF